MCLPSAVVHLLLGAPLEGTAAVAAARVAAAALLTLGIACWLGRGDTLSRAARGLVAAMVIYNLGVAFVLGAAGMRSLPEGIVLWPAAAVLHVVMGIWCITTLMSGKPGTPESGGAQLGLTSR